MADMKDEAVLYKKIRDKKLQCQACNHLCVIENGNVGICGVRKNSDGKINLLVYGKAIGSNIDPIEKKPFFHFYPGSFAYSFGTMGCNFHCGNCQNFDISQMFESKGNIKNYENLNWGYPLSPGEIVENAIKNDCQSIAYTYNEPTIWTEYALDTMKIAKKKGIKNVWVSNGYMSDKVLDAIIPYLNAINIDIKSFDESFYLKNCGAKLNPIFENCKRLIREKIWLEITTLIIPGMSDNKDMLRKIAKFIKNELGDFVPWHLSAFSGLISWKLKNISHTPQRTIEKAYEIGKREGLKNVHSGNILDSGMEDTFCSNCSFKVIDRTGYDVRRSDKNGKCPKCGTKIEGRF